MSVRNIILSTLLYMIAGQSVASDELRRAEMLAFNCFTCHSTGVQGSDNLQSLHELTAVEIRERLQAFKRGEGNPTIMDRIARGYTDAEIDLIARYLAREEHAGD